MYFSPFHCHVQSYGIRKLSKVKHKPSKKFDIITSNKKILYNGSRYSYTFYALQVFLLILNFLLFHRFFLRISLLFCFFYTIAMNMVISNFYRITTFSKATTPITSTTATADAANNVLKAKRNPENTH